MKLRLFTLLVLFEIASSTPMENAIVGSPLVQCKEDYLVFSIATSEPFRGTLFVKGNHAMMNCLQDFRENVGRGAELRVRIGDCGMRRHRQIQPHGVNYEVVIVANFYPLFVTKFDRVFHVRCFYSQADAAVTVGMEVNQMATESIQQETKYLPTCEYSLRDGDVNGLRIQSVVIGRAIVHRWQCDNPNFGMLVRNCIMNDGRGKSVRILDERGCPVAPLPFRPQALTYDPSLNLAFVQVEAFMFPDQPEVRFECQIAVCKKSEDECIGFTPPNCPVIGPNEFFPNSILDVNVNPTQVVAMFEGGVPPPSHLPQDPMFWAFTDNRIPPIPRVFGDGTRRSEHNMIEDDLDDQHMRKENASSTTEQPDDEIQRVIGVFARSTLPPPPQTTAAAEIERERRLADQVMDVAAEPLYVRMDELDMQKQTSPRRSVTCFNEDQVVVAAAAFVLFMLTVSVLLCCIVRTQCRETNRNRHEGLEHFAAQSVCSSADSEDQRLPVYARRLGNPHYLPHVSMYS